MKEKTIKIYQFEELEQKVQRKVIDSFSEITTEDFDYFIVEDAAQSEILIESYDIYNNRCRISFRYNAESAAQKILENHGEECKTYQVAKKYLETMETLDTEKDEELIEYNTDLFRRILARECLQMLKDEYDYTQSDGYVIEFIKGNDYWFRKNGTIEAE